MKFFESLDFIYLILANSRHRHKLLSCTGKYDYQQIFYLIIHFYFIIFLYMCFRDPKEIVRPRIALLDCINSFASVEVVDDFYSTGVQAKTQAHK